MRLALAHGALLDGLHASLEVPSARGCARNYLDAARVGSLCATATATAAAAAAAADAAFLSSDLSLEGVAVAGGVTRPIE